MNGHFRFVFLFTLIGLAWPTNIPAQPSEADGSRSVASQKTQPAAILAQLTALQGDRLAQIAQNNVSVEPAGDDYATDLHALYELVKDGVPSAQYRLAERYRIGLLVERDYTRAIEFYNRSAQQGFALSQFRLAEIFERGKIVKKDLTKAIEFYRKAAEQGHSGAQSALAHSYHIGNGVPIDMAEAIFWYHKAAEQGDALAQLTLGDQYRAGANVPKDLVQSVLWYLRAAEQGNMFAQYELGNAYRYGQGIDKDILQANEWYQLAAKTGNSSAERPLAEIQAEVASFVPSKSVLLSAEIDQTEVASLDLGQESKSELSALTSSAEPNNEAIGSGGEPGIGDEKIDQKIGSTIGTADVQHSAVTDEPTPAPAPAAPAAFENALLLAPPQTNSVEEEISRLLAKAQRQVAQLALTTPTGDNAYETYQQILSLLPNDSAALAGIREVGAKYAALAEQVQARGEFQKADRYAAKAIELAPDHPSVKALETALDTHRQKSQENAPSAATATNQQPPQENSTGAQQNTQNLSVVAVSTLPDAPNQPKIASTGDTGEAKLELVTSGLLYAVSGLDLHRNGNFENAIELYALAIEAGDLNDKSLAYVYNNRGASYRSLGLYDLAIKDYDNAIRLNPDYATAIYNRGIAYDRKGFHELAIDDFDTAFRLKPDLAEALSHKP